MPNNKTTKQLFYGKTNALKVILERIKKLDDDGHLLISFFYKGL